MLAVGDLKQCSTCKAVKPLPAFNKCSRWMDGLQNNCRACQKHARETAVVSNAARCRARYQAKRAEYWQQSRTWGKEHPEALRAIKAKWQRKQALNPAWRAKKVAEALAYARLHPEQRLATGARYRARKRQATVCNLSTEAWQEILATFNHHCAYCLQPFTPTRRPSQDHMVPLSRGGTHEIANVVPACRSCNSIKKDRNLLELVANKRLPTAVTPN